MRAKEFITETALSKVHDGLDLASMALPNTYGEPHQYGPVDVSQSFITIQSDNLKENCNLHVEVKDAQGRIITVRKDDLLLSVNFVGVLVEGGDIPVPGNLITYGGVSYIIDDISNDGTNESFRRVGINARKYQEIN
jgi:hypothetical protein